MLKIKVEKEQNNIEIKESNTTYNEYGWYLDENKNRHFKDNNSFRLFVEMMMEGKIDVE